jgi:hypothetical protein
MTTQMKKPFFILLFACGLLLKAARAELVNFNDAQVGALPSGWKAGVTGPGQPKWSVELDTNAPSPPNVLKQSGEGKFPWCVNTNVSMFTGRVSVKFKAISGKEDEAGGIIWRWQDGDNYYVTRANALEDNVTIYYTINGERHERGRGFAKVTPNAWHTLAVEIQATHFIVYFDDAKVLEWQDDTIKKAGAVGVWTKADSVTEFDDFSWESK